MTRALLVLALVLLPLALHPHTSRPAAQSWGSAEPPVWHLVPVTPRAGHAASRSRTVVGSARGIGRLLDVTAYCATGNRTASGLWPREGMAAGPWPFGTRLHVQSVGVVTVQDRYGHGTQLDLFRDSCADARRFGRQRLRVEVVG